MVENLPSSAEDVGLIPGWGTKIPHVMGQLSLYTATREACAPHTEPTRSRTHAPQ